VKIVFHDSVTGISESELVVKSNQALGTTRLAPAEDIESAYLENLGKKPATVLDKKPSSAAAISSEDVPLRRRAG